MYITTTMCDGVLHCLLFLMFIWCPYMAINVNVQYNGGFLPDIILLTQCYVEFSTISTLESVISVSSDYLCINWYGSSLGVYTRVGVPRLQCLGQ